MADPKKVVTGRLRLSYANLNTPRAAEEGQTPKYSTVLIIPKSDKETHRKILAAIEAAKEEGKSKRWGGKIPKNLNITLKDGDEDADLEQNPEYEGCWYMNVSSAEKPGIVDIDRDPILDPSEIYSGMYARVSIRAFAYDRQGNKGVSFGLNNVQKLGDGDPFGSISRAADDFAEDLDDEDLI